MRPRPDLVRLNLCRPPRRTSASASACSEARRSGRGTGTDCSASLKCAARLGTDALLQNYANLYRALAAGTVSKGRQAKSSNRQTADQNPEGFLVHAVPSPSKPAPNSPQSPAAASRPSGGYFLFIFCSKKMYPGGVGPRCPRRKRAYAPPRRPQGGSAAVLKSSLTICQTAAFFNRLRPPFLLILRFFLFLLVISWEIVYNNEPRILIFPLKGCYP